MSARSDAAPGQGEKALLRDPHGRGIDYIRLSLTDRCNFRCVYCMPGKGTAPVPHQAILTYEELLRFCRAAASLGLERYKVTGGEPFCRKGAVSFMRSLAAVPGVRQVSVTTNGAALGLYLDDLAAMGVTNVNVSLDSLNQARFAAISRSGESVRTVLRALRAAKERGMRVKINTVPLQHYNKADLPLLAAYALEQGYFLRFIELMPVGEASGHEGVPQAAIRRMIEERFGPLAPLPRRIGNGPAEHFTVPGYEGGIGFISALSKKFCHACNRMRLTSQGFLKTCLHHDKGVDIRALLRSGADDAALCAAIKEAVAQKPPAHNFDPAAKGGTGRFTMNCVGG